MSPQVAAGFWREAIAAGDAVEQLFRPLKMNYQLLGNAVPHTHFHITLRYATADDPAPGGPLPIAVLDHGHQDEDRLRADATALRDPLAPPVDRLDPTRPGCGHEPPTGAHRVKTDSGQ